MEAKLQSLKVPELKALLTQASLPTTGVKLDLITRLLENPQATASLDGEAADSAPKSAAPAAPATPATPAAPAVSAAPKAATTGKNGKSEATAVPKTSTVTETAAAPAEPEQSEDERRQVLIAELEKRKARAAKFGQPLGEAEAKLERLIKFGIDPTEEAAVSKLAKPLGTSKARGREAKQTTDKAQQGQKKEVASISSKPQESEEEKAARLAKLEVEKEKARKRAERFGIPTNASAAAAPATNPEEEERKRKREEKFAASSVDKKVKT